MKSVKTHSAEVPVCHRKQRSV